MNLVAATKRWGVSLQQLQSAFELLAQSDIADFHGAKSEELIRQAENALDLRFPPTYRAFVSRFGCGGLRGYEFYGLIDENFVNSGIPNAVWLALRDRIDYGLPKSFIPICDTGLGGYYVIDVSQINADGDSPVIEFWPGAPDPIGKNCIAKDFGEFFCERVRDAIERD